VNGETVTKLGVRADPDNDDIRVDGRRLRRAQRRRYILLNKPRGYVTTRSDPQGRPTVIDLIRRVREYVYPVGRLDYDSEGLLILTNDGDLAMRLMHPKHGIDRVYEARVRGVPDQRAIERLSKGVVLDGRRTAPAEVRVETARARSEEATILLTLREGRTRQVRRMCAVVGHTVRRLRRTRIGPIVDTDLRPGSYRELTEKEVRRLKAAVSNGKTVHRRD
jgi:23S rRNA pseudouridine2605 synthase